MNFAVAAAITAIILFFASHIERRKGDALPWLAKAVMALRLLVFVFVGLYIYFRVTS